MELFPSLLAELLLPLWKLLLELLYVGKALLQLLQVLSNCAERR